MKRPSQTFEPLCWVIKLRSYLPVGLFLKFDNVFTVKPLCASKFWPPINVKYLCLVGYLIEYKFIPSMQVLLAEILIPQILFVFETMN